MVGNLVTLCIASINVWFENCTDKHRTLSHSWTYDFELGHKTTEATKNIRCVKGEIAVDQSTVSRRLKKCHENFDDQARSAKPKMMDSEVMDVFQMDPRANLCIEKSGIVQAWNCCGRLNIFLACPLHGHGFFLPFKELTALTLDNSSQFSVYCLFFLGQIAYTYDFYWLLIVALNGTYFRPHNIYFFSFFLST